MRIRGRFVATVDEEETVRGMASWSPGEHGGGCQLGAAMLLVADEPERTERRLADGELACPDCTTPLAPLGHARTRRLRARDGHRMIRPRRGRCPGCGHTHVLRANLAPDVCTASWSTALTMQRWAHVVVRMASVIVVLTQRGALHKPTRPIPLKRAEMAHELNRGK